MHRYISVIIDEMKIHEDLVFDKTGCNLLGFVNLGTVNEQLQQMENEIKLAQPHKNIASYLR